MHLMFKKGNVFDRSPFQYGTMGLLESRILTYQSQMEQVSKTLVGRIDGNKNILMRILQSIDLDFGGDLVEYMNKVHTRGMDLSRTIGMTSNYGAGRLHYGTFYDGCTEIFIAGRNEEYVWTDLWHNWMTVSPVTVLDHPFTEMTYFMPGVTNRAKIKGGGEDRLAIFFVDIALLYVQWNLYRGSRRDPSMELYITEVVYPNMMRSHMDIVMLNRTLLHLGIIEECKVRSNLPFQQTPTDYEVDRIIDIVLKNYSGRRMTPELYISTIPGIFKEDLLKSIDDPQLMPTIQSMWATLATKMKRVALVLEMAKNGSIMDMGYFLSRLRRTIIQNESQKRFDVVSGGDLIKERFEHFVTSRLPE